MQRHHIAFFRLKVQKLVNVRHISASDSARPPTIGVIWPDVPFGRVLVHSFSQQPFDHKNNAHRTAVIVNRRALSRPPAKHQQFGKRASSYQIASILSRGESTIRLVITLPEQESGKPLFDLLKFWNCFKIFDGLRQLVERQLVACRNRLWFVNDICVSYSHDSSSGLRLSSILKSNPRPRSRTK